MPTPFHPAQHPHRAMLHNEIHARPPEAMNAPVAIAHIVMLADAAGREASRAHVAALLRDHHMALPDAQTTHLRMDLGAFRMRWELHTEFVTWTFMVPAPVEAFGEREPVSAVDSVPRDWLAALPGQCLCSLNLWVLPTHTFGSGSLVKHVLHEDTLVASTVADGHGEVYTDFAIHADGFSRMVLLAGGMTPRRLGRLVQRLLEIEQQQSSQALLTTMNHRQDLQLQMQSTVEGLSVAAITYYIVGLVSYLAKGAQKLGWPLSAETTAALAIPVVAVGVWWALRRLHQRVFHQHR